VTLRRRTTSSGEELPVQRPRHAGVRGSCGRLPEPPRPPGVTGGRGAGGRRRRGAAPDRGGAQGVLS
jgi:hypothetical protein